MAMSVEELVSVIKEFTTDFTCNGVCHCRDCKLYKNFNVNDSVCSMICRINYQLQECE